jgi:hypothetical protein
MNKGIIFFSLMLIEQEGHRESFLLCSIHCLMQLYPSICPQGRQDNLCGIVDVHFSIQIIQSIILLWSALDWLLPSSLELSRIMGVRFPWTFI